MAKSIIIIGGGIAGLSAGCFARMNGYQTQIFEMHDMPGGLCTAWERKGYTIDGCLHWLVGSAPGSELYHIWQELGILQGQRVINVEQFHRIEGKDGKVFNMYCDIDRLEQEMMRVAPEDKEFTAEIIKAVRHFTRFEMPAAKAPELYGPLDGLKLLSKMRPYLGAIKKWDGMTMKELAAHFKNPLMRETWQVIWPSDFSAIFILITLALLHKKEAGYIIGGSMQVSRAIEKRYLGLGGELKYRSRVTKILVENSRAIGVRLEDGSEHRADCVISAADGHAAIFDLLEGKYINDEIRGYYQKMKIFTPLIYIGLGVNRTFDDVPKLVSGLELHLEKPLSIGGPEQRWLFTHIYNFDPTLAPPGKTSLTVMIDSNYAYWESLRKDMPRYKAEKEQIGNQVVSVLDKRFPGLASQVEMRDVATPVTFHRYTGNWQGCYEGWLMTPGTVNMRMSKTLPGLAGFYMIGQWVSPGGGLPSGAMTGRHVVQILCKHDKKQFVTSVP